MAFDFEKMKQDVVSLGKEVGDKVTEVSNVTKIKIDIRSKEDYLQKQYAALGKAYYFAHKDEIVVEQEYFASIEEALKEIAKLNDELLATQGSVMCPNCNKRLEKGHAFCSECGTKL